MDAAGEGGCINTGRTFLRKEVAETEVGAQVLTQLYDWITCSPGRLGACFSKASPNLAGPSTWTATNPTPPAPQSSIGEAPKRRWGERQNSCRWNCRACDLGIDRFGRSTWTKRYGYRWSVCCSACVGALGFMYTAGWTVAPVEARAPTDLTEGQVSCLQRLVMHASEFVRSSGKKPPLSKLTEEM